MSNSVTDLRTFRSIKRTEQDLVELKEMGIGVKNAMNCLTKFRENYIMRRQMGTLLETYQTIQHAISKKEEVLVRLQIRKEHE